MSLVVCFSGRIGSGKTSVSRNVATALNASWTGFGDLVRAAAATRNLDTESRQVLQDLGASLIQEHGMGWLCEQVINRADWDGHQVLVIDGVRHVEVLDQITARLADHRTVLIHLDFDGTAPRERAINPDARKTIEQHSTERDVLLALPERADLVVSTDPPLDEVVNNVLDFVRPLARQYAPVSVHRDA